MNTQQEKLFQALKQGALVVTPNNRIAEQILLHYHQYQAQAVVEKPLCVPYQVFLQFLMQTVRNLHPYEFHPVVLNTVQQQYLWQTILKHDFDFQLPQGLVNAVNDAWQRCLHWQINFEDPGFAQNNQHARFQSWAQTFKTTLEQQNVITTEQIIDYIMPFLQEKPLDEVIWAHFNDFSPQQVALQKKLQQLGCQQTYYDRKADCPDLAQFAATDSQEEYQQLILWLKKNLTDGHVNLGVVIPELQKEHRVLKRLFSRHFNPEQFNISLGEPLPQYPLAAHALMLLGLNQPKLNNSQVRLLLQTPYIDGGQNEFHARAQVLQSSGLLKEATIPLQNFIRDIQPQCPKLAELLHQLPAYPSKASVNEWQTVFKNRLQYFQFPGDEALDSAGYQCFQRLMILMDEFLQFNVVADTFSQQEAIAALHFLASQTVFQIQKAPTPIQILGLLEASGCMFDKLWVCGLTDQCLPQKVQLSAFIPITLQREQHMPKSLPENELKYGKMMLERLIAGSQQTVVSYPKLLGDTPNLPSPLIQHLPPYIALKDDISPQAKLLLETYETPYQIPVQPDETIKGGTAILANQAKCPFRAFAKHRLHANPENEISAGPDPLERGQTLHKILELLWQDIGSQQRLLQRTPEELDHQLERAISEALQPIKKQRLVSFSEFIENVEVERLKKLVLTCLEWEKNRQPFSVKQLEQAYHLNLAGLEFKVRVDRVDTVAEGEWMIDYKSTMPNIKPWNQERPEEPQLLLYALLTPNIEAILFLQIKAGQLACSGISALDVPMTGISSIKKDKQWSDYLQLWQEQLTLLAEEFQNGICSPTPNRPSICQTCDFPSLCRIA